MSARLAGNPGGPISTERWGGGRWHAHMGHACSMRIVIVGGVAAGASTRRVARRTARRTAGASTPSTALTSPPSTTRAKAQRTTATAQIVIHEPDCHSAAPGPAPRGSR
jgi:hypothetical protein